MKKVRSMILTFIALTLITYVDSYEFYTLDYPMIYQESIKVIVDGGMTEWDLYISFMNPCEEIPHHFVKEFKNDADFQLLNNSVVQCNLIFEDSVLDMLNEINKINVTKSYDIKINIKSKPATGRNEHNEEIRNPPPHNNLSYRDPEDLFGNPNFPQYDGNKEKQKRKPLTKRDTSFLSDVT